MTERKPKATGDCYESAIHDLLDGGGTLVHAIVTGQGKIEGIRHGHAWVERGLFAIDKSNGRDIIMPAAIYRLIGKVTFAEEWRYSRSEAVALMRKHQTYGPWEDALLNRP